MEIILEIFCVTKNGMSRCVVRIGTLTVSIYHNTDTKVHSKQKELLRSSAKFQVSNKDKNEKVFVTCFALGTASMR